MVHIGMGRGRFCAATTCGLAVGQGCFVEGAAYDREIEGRSRGQAELALEGDER